MYLRLLAMGRWAGFEDVSTYLLHGAESVSTFVLENSPAGAGEGVRGVSRRCGRSLRGRLRGDI